MEGATSIAEIGIAVLGLAFTVLGGLFYFVYNGLQQKIDKLESHTKERIDKMEEVSKNEDLLIRDSIDKTAEAVQEVDEKHRLNIHKVFDKIEGLGREVSRSEARVDCLENHK
jgi:uncharacterized protein YoxC